MDSFLPPRRLPWTDLWLLAPFLAHIGLTAAAGATGEYLEFGPLDWGVFAATALYVVAALPALRGGRFGRGFVRGSGYLLIVLLVFEAVARAVYPFPPAQVPFRTGTTQAEIKYDLPGLHGSVQLTTNELGLIGDEINQRDLDAMDLRILCVGGSTTESIFVTDGKRWPRALQDKLAARLGRRVFVGNAGRSGNFTLHHINQLRDYPLAQKFDFVVIQVGCTDFTAHDEGVYYGEDLREGIRKYSLEQVDARAGLTTYYRALSSYRLLSRLLGRAPPGWRPPDVNDGRVYVTERQRRQEALAHGVVEDPPPRLDRYLAHYREDLRSLIEMCRELRLEMVFTTQPHLFHAGMPPDLEALLNSGLVYDAERPREVDITRGAYSPAALERAIDAFNRTTLEICAQEGVDCIDLAGILPHDTSVFYDDYHFNISGCDRVAEILADHFTSRLGGTRRGETIDAALDDK